MKKMKLLKSFSNSKLTDFSSDTSVLDAISRENQKDMNKKNKVPMRKRKSSIDGGNLATKTSRMASSLGLFGIGKNHDSKSKRNIILRRRRKLAMETQDDSGEEERSQGTLLSQRIGIVRPNYEEPDDPLSYLPKSNATPIIEDTRIKEEEDDAVPEREMFVFDYDFVEDEELILTEDMSSLSKGDKNSENNDEGTAATTQSLRIGINRPNYEVPGDMIMTFSPLNFNKNKNKLDEKRKIKPVPKRLYTIKDNSNKEKDFDEKIPELSPISLQSELATPENQVKVNSFNTDDEMIQVVGSSAFELKLLNANEDRISFQDHIKEDDLSARHINLDGGMKQSVEFRKKYEVALMRGRTKMIEEIPKTKKIDEDSTKDLGVSIKVFLLLIQPKSKIFEIIQVLFPPKTTTVNDILGMIPNSSTEPLLGSQNYVGLCRPHNGEEMSVNMTATTSPSDELVGARISCGEILVAIPEGPYNGKKCAKIAKPLLLNPKVARLLEKSYIDAPKRQKRKKNRKSRKTSLLIETVLEENNNGVDGSCSTTDEMESALIMNEEQEIHKALQNAAVAAAHSNAASDDSISTSSFPVIKDSSMDIWKPNMFSLRSRLIRHNSSIGDNNSLIISQNNSFDSGVPTDISIGNTMDDSVSLTVSCCTDNQYLFKRIPRRRTRRPFGTIKKRNAFHYSLGASIIISFMIVRYLMATSDKQNHNSVSTSSTGFKIMEMAQFVLAFYVICTLQKFWTGEKILRDHPVYRFSKKSLRYFRATISLKNSLSGR